MPRATRSSVPKLGLSKMSSHTSLITLTGMIRTLKAMPATPTLLLVAWPMVPATWVPWPSRSSGRSSSQMKSRGDTKRLVSPRSGAAAKGTSMTPSAG